MAANLRELAHHVSTEEALREAVSDGYFAAGFVDRRLSHEASAHRAQYGVSGRLRHCDCPRIDGSINAGE